MALHSRRNGRGQSINAADRLTPRPAQFTDWLHHDHRTVDLQNEHGSCGHDHESTAALDQARLLMTNSNGRRGTPLHRRSLALLRTAPHGSREKKSGCVIGDAAALVAADAMSGGCRAFDIETRMTRIGAQSRPIYGVA